jgi:hypothetical protein
VRQRVECCSLWTERPVGLTGSLLLMDIEVNSLSTEQSLKQPL